MAKVEDNEDEYVEGTPPAVDDDEDEYVEGTPSPEHRMTSIDDEIEDRLKITTPLPGSKGIKRSGDKLDRELEEAKKKKVNDNTRRQTSTAGKRFMQFLISSGVENEAAAQFWKLDRKKLCNFLCRWIFYDSLNNKNGHCLSPRTMKA